MKWDPNRYRTHCGHVTERGKGLVELLRGRGLTRVWNLGCGDGALSGEIAACGRWPGGVSGVQG